MRGALLCTMVVAALGCGGDGDLGRDVVTNLPDGTASGTAATGTYDIDLYTSACSGACAASTGIFTASVCDVGQRNPATMTVVQTDGHLQVDAAAGSLMVTRLEGGIDADDSFDVGGYGTQNGGTVDVTARARGTMGATLTGTVNAHATGPVGSAHLDCWATYELTGTRK
jgi:hypothetical protein